jgi:Mrp family chromosome partitioning ATPase/capsular polysaccharide biosynthesis protein
VDPLDYLKILRRRWTLIAAAGLVALVTALVTMPSAPSGGLQVPTAEVTQYKATTTLLQTTSDAATVPLATLPIFVSTGDVPKAAAKTLHFDGDPNLLGQRVNVNLDDETGTIGITASDPDANQATAIADAFSDALIQYLRKRAQSDIDRKITLLEDVLGRYRDRRATITGSDDLAVAQRAALDDAVTAVQQEITSLQVSSATAGFDLDVLQPATAIPVLTKSKAPVASGPTSRWKRFVLLLLVGLGLGTALALAVERFDTRLRGRSATESALGVPDVASVPTLPHRARGRHEVAAAVDPVSGVAESYRSLRAAVQLLPSRPLTRRDQLGPAAEADEPAVRDPRVLLFVSANAREGKTTSLVNLASTLAETGRTVIVLDCDFRHPEAHLYLGVPAGRGLSDLLAADREVPLTSVLQPTSLPAVRLAPAGTSTTHPGALMGLMGRLVEEARSLADVVLVDAPPALVASDAVDLMPLVDTAVVVVREGRTGHGDAERLVSLLGQLRTPVLGAVLVATRDAGASYFRRGSSGQRGGDREHLARAAHRSSGPGRHLRGKK